MWPKKIYPFFSIGRGIFFLSVIGLSDPCIQTVPQRIYSPITAWGAGNVYLLVLSKWGCRYVGAVGHKSRVDRVTECSNGFYADI